MLQWSFKLLSWLIYSYLLFLSQWRGSVMWLPTVHSCWVRSRWSISCTRHRKSSSSTLEYLLQCWSKSSLFCHRVLFWSPHHPHCELPVLSTPSSKIVNSKHILGMLSPHCLPRPIPRNVNFLYDCSAVQTVTIMGGCGIPQSGIGIYELYEVKERVKSPCWSYCRM